MKQGYWTLEAWIEHSNELDKERERALSIKETADARALVLASENQRLRDEQHNGLLNQLRDERATYVSRAEWNAQHEALQNALINGLRPLNEFVQNYRGAESKVETRRASANLTTNVITACIIAAGAIATAFIAIH